MFAEELSSNASRKRQQEARARRQQLKNDQKKSTPATTTTATTPATTATSVVAVPNGTLPSSATTTATTTSTSLPRTGVAMGPEAASMVDTGTSSATTTTNKSAAVVAAMQQRQLRQNQQLQTKSCLVLQAWIRGHFIRRRCMTEQLNLLDKRLKDWNQLAMILQKKQASPKRMVPPVATTTALVRQVLFLTRPQTRRVSTRTSAMTCPGGIQRFSGLLLRLLETCVLPGVTSSDDTANPLLQWLQQQQQAKDSNNSGMYRAQRFLHICWTMAVTPLVPVNTVQAITTLFQCLLTGTYHDADTNVSSVANTTTTMTSTTKSTSVLTPMARSIVVTRCREWYLSSSQPATASSSSTTTTSFSFQLQLFPTIRRFLLWNMAGNQPIPTSSVTLREGCISAKERAHADCLVALLLHVLMVDNNQQQQQNNKWFIARFVTDILTIPLLTWKISPKTVAQLVEMDSHSNNNNNNKPLIVTLLAAMMERYQESLALGHSLSLILPQVATNAQEEGDFYTTSKGVAMSQQCPATNTQCLLANLMLLGRLCPSLNGSSLYQTDYLAAALFFQIVALLVDVVPLGTFVTRDSAAIEWITDETTGHCTAVVLSPVVLEHCRLLLVESYCRALFAVAIQAEQLDTQTILAHFNDDDRKQEQDLHQAAATATGGGAAGSTAAISMAAKEATMDHRQHLKWLPSAKWASKIKKGVLSVMTTTTTSTANTTTNAATSGQGMLLETSSVSRQLAKGDATAPTSQNSLCKQQQEQEMALAKHRVAASYSPALLLALCRCYAIVLARWGGAGKADIISQAEGQRKNEIATSRPDPCTMALLNVLCFGTDVVRTSWALLQSDDRDIASDLAALTTTTSHGTKGSIQAMTARPTSFGKANGKMDHDGAVLLYIFVATMSHTLIVTDDVEIYEMSRPLPPHQLRRCIQLLKKVLIRACAFPTKSTGTPFGLSLVSASVKVMRDLYDRSARRPLCVPKLWLVDNLMVKEIQACKTHRDYVELLSTPVFRICPFMVSFKRRLKLFERIVTTSRIEMQGVNDANPFNSNPLKPGIPVKIMRGRILEDGLATLNKLGRNLRQRINVQYVNEAGTRESGVDAGGLFKEFWTDLCAIAFNPNYALFRVTEDEQNCLYPNPSSGAAHGSETHVVLFEFLGRILGKALYEGITISPQFSHFFLSFLRGDYNYLHMLPDLASVDKQLYNNLMFLKTYDGDAEDLCLTFSVAVEEFGGTREIPLIPNGASKEVTNANKQHYIGLVAKFYVVDRVKEQSEAFTRGLWDVIDKSWLRLFNEPELQVLISGATGGAIDVEDMRAHSRYIGGYTGIEITIRRFWNVVASFNTKQQADLLRFVTSCERPPPLGFASMNPPFTIQRVGILRDGDLLPTASTCFNTLKLPTYSSEKVMKQRLLYAIESGAGFELT